MKYWAYQLKGTVFEAKGRKEAKGFLDPWTSLFPRFLKKKLSPDVLAIFTESGTQINGHAWIEKTAFPFWALIFPKRSYMPPDYPHLQLWFLGQSFAPSLSFVDQRQQDLMVKIIGDINRAFDCFTDVRCRQCDRTFAINATPFSFIKDKEGKFYGGGQSVRTFHLHCFLMPQKLKKIKIPKERAPLVYPTLFSLELFKLIFGYEKIHKVIFEKKKETFKITRRGVVFNWHGDLKKLVSVLNKIDQIFYQLQLILIHAFYRDSRNFLGKLGDLMAADYLEKIKGEKKKLILLGKERGLREAKRLLKKELTTLGKSYGLDFSEKKTDKVCQLLTMDKNGDLSSWVDDQVVALRPGMGYGCLVRLKGNHFSVHLSPLDSLLPEGTMESSGYLFVDKIKIKKKPFWLKSFIDCFQSSVGEQKIG